MKALRAEQPQFFSRSLEAINRIRMTVRGRAAVIDIAEAIFKCEREEVSSVRLPQPAATIYEAMAGKYTDPYLRTACSKCEEFAELCPHCESPELEIKVGKVTCGACGRAVTDGTDVVLRCLAGHTTRAPLVKAFCLAPNHWFQKRMVRIFEEVDLEWREESDYFYLEGSTLYRLRSSDRISESLAPLILYYISNFWDKVEGPLHTGGGDIVND
jgi:hypothetical protein